MTDIPESYRQYGPEAAEIMWQQHQLIERLERDNDSLRAEVEALKPDAERYRKIRPYLEIQQHAGIWWLGETNNIGRGRFSSVDTAIDSLRSEGE